MALTCTIIGVHSRAFAAESEVGIRQWTPMDANGREWLLKDEVYAIAGAAMEESGELGPDFLEAVYQEALKIELEERRIPFAAPLPIEISYKGGSSRRIERKRMALTRTIIGVHSRAFAAEREVGIR